MSARKSGGLILAIDLGGTKLRSALVNEAGKILRAGNLQTRAEKGPEYIIERIIGLLENTLKQSRCDKRELSAVCLAIAGPVDVKNGILTSSPHLPGWKNVPLRKIIKERTGVETFIDNDVNAAALGEKKFGIARKANNFIFIAIGTGVGGGIVIDGKLYRGVDGSAGEIGHMIVKENGPKCSCGSRGCLEAMCAGVAIEREIRNKTSKLDPRLVIGTYGSEAGKITARDTGKAAQNGDAIACQVISKAAYYLGIGLSNVINIFNPEMIVLGGGIIKIGDIYTGPAIEIALKTTFKLPAGSVKIVKSSLGDDAGILGAAALAEN